MYGKKYKKTISIEGMHCEHCAKKVEETFKSIEGVNKVKVNLLKKEAIISLEFGTNNSIPIAIRFIKHK